MKKIRVLLCAPNFNRGGAERMSIQLFEALDRDRFDVKIYVHERLDVQFDPNSKYDRDVIYGSSGFYRRYRLFGHFLRTLWLARSADVIIGVSEGRASGVALAAGILTRRPVVLWLHSDWSKFSQVVSWRTKAIVYAFGRAKAIVACSKGVAKAHLGSFPGNEKLLRVVENCVDIKAIKAKSREDIADRAKDLLQGKSVVAVGRLSHEKGFDLLVQAHAAALKMGAMHQLVIVGEGTERTALENLAQKLRVEASVHLIGFTENPYKYLAKATVFVSSSRFEGFGLVIAEALACATPTIAFDCPSGPSEILDHGRYGVIVPPQDTKALARAISELLASPDRRLALSRAGPTRARDFDIEVFRDRWKNVIEDVVLREGIRQSIGAPS